MTTINARDRQTLFDIAIQHCGSREAAFEIASLNDLSLTAELTADLAVVVPDTTDAISRRVVDYYRNNSLVPATADRELADFPEGIMTSNNEQYRLISNEDELFLITNNL